MRKLLATTTDTFRSNGQDYSKVVVTREDGSPVQGTRTIHAFTGSKLKRVLRDVQEDIDNGAVGE